MFFYVNIYKEGDRWKTNKGNLSSVSAPPASVSGSEKIIINILKTYKKTDYNKLALNLVLNLF